MALQRVTNGVHMPNLGMWDIEQALRVARNTGAVTILHQFMFEQPAVCDGNGDPENDNWYSKLRWGWPAQGIPAAPERLIHIRIYTSNWRDWDPKVIAQRAAPMFANWRSSDRFGPVRTANLWDDPFVCVSPANEQNIEGPLSTDYATMAKWQLDFWHELDRLVPNRKALSCMGAFAFGHDVIPDTPDSEYTVPEVRALCNYVDILATHPYAILDRPEPEGSATADPARAAFYFLLRDFRPAGYRDSRQPGRPHDIGGILAQVPNKPLLITESGTFVHGDNWRNNETEAAMRLLLDTAARSGRCLGVTWFIWNSDAGHAGNRIHPNTDLRNRMEQLPDYPTTCKVPVKGQSTGGGDTVVEYKFWPILQRHASEAGITAVDVRARLMRGGQFGPLNPANVEAVAIHHTAGAESVTWESVADYHVTGRGFYGIGYHVGVRNGAIAYLGDLNEARAHVTNQNHKLIGLCMAGNYETSTPSEANMKALKVAYQAICEWIGRTVPPRAHGAITGATQCPGRNLNARLPGLLTNPDTSLALALGKWGDVAQSIQINPGAGLYREMTAHGFYPISDESGARGVVPLVEGHPDVVAQLARQWGGAAERIYWWSAGRVGFVARH